MKINTNVYEYDLYTYEITIIYVLSRRHEWSSSSGQNLPVNLRCVMTSYRLMVDNYPGSMIV